MSSHIKVNFRHPVIAIMIDSVNQMLDFYYDKADLYRVAWQLRHVNRACRILDRVFFITVPLMLFVVGRARMASDFWFLAAVIAGTLAWCVLAPWLHRKLSNGVIALKMLDNYRKLPAGGHVNVSIDPRGVKWTSTHVDSFTPWNKVRQMVITTDYVFLRVAFTSYHWIPLRAFKGYDQLLSIFSQLEINTGLTLKSDSTVSNFSTTSHRSTTGCSGIVQRLMVLVARHRTAN